MTKQTTEPYRSQSQMLCERRPLTDRPIEKRRALIPRFDLGLIKEIDVEP